jgi:hypothetical protein
MFVSRSIAGDSDIRRGSTSPNDEPTTASLPGTCPFILVEAPTATSPDALDSGVIPALLALISGDIKSTLRSAYIGDELPEVSVAAVTLSRPVYALASALPPTSTVLDGFSDWAGYSHEDTGPECIGECVHVSASGGGQSVLDALTACTRPQADSADGDDGLVVLVLDDLGPLLRVIPDVTCIAHALEDWRSTGRVAAFIACLTETSQKTNSRDAMFANALKRLAITRVRVSQATSLPPAGVSRTRHAGMVSSIVDIAVTRLRPSGRVHVENTAAVLDDSFGKCTLTVTTEASDDGKPRKAEDEAAREEGSARERMAKLGLTFNVGLTEQERAARSSVRLPYVHQNEDLANSGLELHPESLQLSNSSRHDSGGSTAQSPSSSSSDEDMDEEFEESEDV